MGDGDFNDGFYMDDESIVDTRSADDDCKFEDLKLLMADVIKRLERLEARFPDSIIPYTNV